MATKKTTKKASAKKAKTTAKKTAPKKCAEGVSMKNFLILWACIAAIILLAVAVFSYLIPKAKALEAAQNAPSVKHMPSLEVTEE